MISNIPNRCFLVWVVYEISTIIYETTFIALIYKSLIFIDDVKSEGTRKPHPQTH